MYKTFILLIASCIISTASLEAAKPAVWLLPEEQVDAPLHVAVIGTGYVGLTLGVCLAECGHRVTCVDIDPAKIDTLRKGIAPLFEPGLEELLATNIQKGRIAFTTCLKDAVQANELLFIAVGTPTAQDGSADVNALMNVVDGIADAMDDYKLVCVKSTVPVGTGRAVAARLVARNGQAAFDLVSNPEFFREGCAVPDFFYADRIIIGCQTSRAKETMEALYKPLADRNIPLLFTTIESSEAIKYASNAFLAVKISYVNELAAFCEQFGADVEEVTEGMGLDTRIGKQFLKAGPGYGGSCFPKDISAILHAAERSGMDMRIIRAAFETNESQKQRVADRMAGLLGGDLQGKTIGVLGLAFKANTDDVRCAPALAILPQLMAQGATIRAYDPHAMQNMQRELPSMTYCENAYACATGADAILVLTEWEEFSCLDMGRLCREMKTPIFFDTRNVLTYDPQQLEGITLAVIGKSDPLLPEPTAGEIAFEECCKPSHIQEKSTMPL